MIYSRKMRSNEGCKGVNLKYICYMLLGVSLLQRLDATGWFIQIKSLFASAWMRRKTIETEKNIKFIVKFYDVFMCFNVRLPFIHDYTLHARL